MACSLSGNSGGIDGRRNRGRGAEQRARLRGRGIGRLHEGRQAVARSGVGHSGTDRAVLPSLVTAKLAVYETMRALGWSKSRLAQELGTSENAVRRLLDLEHNSHMWIIDDALAKMNAELSIALPKPRRREAGTQSESGHEISIDVAKSR